MWIWLCTDVISSCKFRSLDYSFFHSDHNTRRQFSKSESLLVSLLKQEAIGEKKQELQLNKTSSITKTTNQKLDDDIVYDSSIVQLKLDRKDPDFVIKKSKNSKKTSTKTQVCMSIRRKTKHSFSLLLKTLSNRSTCFIRRSRFSLNLSGEAINQKANSLPQTIYKSRGQSSNCTKWPRNLPLVLVSSISEQIILINHLYNVWWSQSD